jgi:hypothetical protein
LAGAALALVLQSLSSGYYLLFFSPVAAAFALWEIGSRGLWRDVRVWRDLSLVGVCVAVLVLPFLLPYAALREELRATRSITEVAFYSADLYSYATAFSEQRIWGDLLRVAPRAEGDLFPGLVPVLLALIGVAAGVRAAMRSSALPATRRRWLAWLLGIVGVSHALAALVTLVWRRIAFDTGWFVLRITNINQMLLRSGIAFGLLLVVSPRFRARVSAFMRDRGFFVLGVVAALWLSLGPSPLAVGRPLEIASPYLLLYEYVPAFDGLRVPARLAMLVALMLAVLAGYGAHAVSKCRGGIGALAVLCVFFMLEATHLPFTLNGMAAVQDLATPEARVHPPRQAPAVYGEMARQPEDSVLVELPMGQVDYDIRAVYYSTVHWRRIVNGYSGFFPPHYGLLRTALSEVPRHPEVSIEALHTSGATHVIVHEGAYLAGEGEATSAALRAAGAVELFRQGSDVLLRLAP